MSHVNNCIATYHGLKTFRNTPLEFITSHLESTFGRDWSSRWATRNDAGADVGGGLSALMTSSSRSGTSRRARKARGAIAIDVAGVEESPEWVSVCVLRTGRPRFVAGIDPTMTPGYYVADGQIQQIGIEWPIPEVVRIVRQYDPEREVLFVFLREDGGVSSYRIRVPGAPTPPEAYAQYKEEL